MIKRQSLIRLLIGCAGLAITTKALSTNHSLTKATIRHYSNETTFSKIDSYLIAQMKRLQIPGASLAIIEGDQIMHKRGFGKAFQNGITPSPQTPFFIGSLTKSFTALAVMQLVEAKKIDLDKPVQFYLPWFRVADTQQSKKITIRHLLNQTSALPLLTGWQVLSDFNTPLTAKDHLLRVLTPLKLKHPVGSSFEYSNLNYDLLGLVIEVTSGISYSEYVQQLIFTPLHMQHSYTSKNDAKKDGLATGHQSWFGFPIQVPDLPVPKNSLPSGQLISCAEDMAHFLIAFINGGRFEKEQIVSSKGIAQLIYPAAETKLLDGSTGWYGMGWYIGNQEAGKLLSHSGLVPDYYAYMAVLPEQKKGMVLLVNIDHFTMQITMSEVCAGIVKLIDNQPSAPIRFSAIPWVQRGLLLIPILQLIDFIFTLRILHRQQNGAINSKKKFQVWRKHFLLPTIFNFFVSLTLIPAISKIGGFLMLFAPDFSWIARISGSFAGIWTFLRIAIFMKVFQSKKEPNHG